MLEWIIYATADHRHPRLTTNISVRERTIREDQWTIRVQLNSTQLNTPSEDHLCALDRDGGERPASRLMRVHKRASGQGLRYKNGAGRIPNNGRGVWGRGWDVSTQWLIWWHQQWPLWRGRQSLVSQEPPPSANDVFLKAIRDRTLRLRKAGRLSLEIHLRGGVWQGDGLNLG